MTEHETTRLHTSSWRVGIVIGFATAVLMWLIAFLLHLQGMTAHASVTGIALILTQFAGCMCAGRYASPASGHRHHRAAWRIGLATGLTASILNLFILGSVLTEPAATDAEAALRPHAGIMVAGYLLVGTIVGVLGAIAGSKVFGPSEHNEAEPRDHDRWVSRFAWVAAAAVLPVLFTGGLTTSNQAGLAVPDWWSTYATNMFLFPLSSMTGGIVYEHSHRLFGSLAGFTALGLLLYCLSARFGPRSKVPARRAYYTRASILALVAGLAVLGQGVLGGIRVVAADGAGDQEAWSAASRQVGPQDISRSYALTTDNPTSLTLALTHGITGQLTFALLCVIAILLSRRWVRSRSTPRVADAVLAVAAPGFFIIAVLQLALGSILRHMHHFHALYAHIGVGTLLVVLAVLASSRAIMRHKEAPPILLLGKGLIAVVMAQFILGWIALAVVVPHYVEPGTGTSPLTEERPERAVFVGTMHQMNGALVLAVSAMLALWTWRHISMSKAPKPELQTA